MKTRWRVAGAVAIAATVIAIVLVAPRLGRRLAFFRVRQLEVIGTRYLDEAAVVRGLGLRPDASTLDRLDAVRKAAMAEPGVVSATVERQLPATLRVIVREATPVALVALTDRLRLVDSAGHLLPFDPVRSPASLPIAGSDSVTPGLLGRLMRTDPLLYAMIVSAHLDRGDVVLDIDGRRIRLRPEADDAVLRAVATVLSYLNSHAVAWREIDARYRWRVFVQKGAA